MKKKILSVLLSLTMVLGTGMTAFAAEKEPEPSLTVEKYAEFLAKESPKDFQKFEALSPADQEKFIGYLLDPATYTGELNTPDVTTRSSTIERSVKNSSGADMGLARTTTWDAWGTHTATILGIDVLEYRIEVGYQVSGNRITGINYNDAYIVRNLNPMVQTDTTSKSAYISGNVVHAKGIFYYKLGPIEGLSIQIGNIHGELLGYSDGGTSISYWRD